MDSTEQPKKTEYVPTPEELEGDTRAYCYGGQDWVVRKPRDNSFVLNPYLTRKDKDGEHPDSQ